MAEIPSSATQRAAERPEAVLTAVGEKFDVFVSYRMRQVAAEDEPARTAPDNEPADTATPFRPLDADIASDAIPAFFIGRDKDGFWIAATPRDEPADFFCARLPRCHLRGRRAGRRAAQRSSRPTGSNSI